MGLKPDGAPWVRQGFWRRAARAVFVLLEARANRYRLDTKMRRPRERPVGRK